MEYTWLLSLMNIRVDSEAIYRRVLNFILNHLKLDYTEGDLGKRHAAYLELEQVPVTLKTMIEYKELAILSNGTSKMIGAVPERSSLKSSFQSVISVEREDQAISTRVRTSV